MKKGFFKIVAGIMTLGLIIVLASCDIHLEKLFETSNKNDSGTEIVETTDDGKNKKDGNIDNNTETGSGSSGENNTDTNNNNGNNNSVNEKTDEEELKIKDLILDYTNSYGYQKLGEIATYGEDMQTIYSEAFEAAKVVLTSADNYSTTAVNVKENGVLVSKNYYMLPAISITDDKIKSSSFTMDMAISAVMEMLYDNPLFYYLNSGYLSGTDNIYLTLIDEYATAASRTTMNNNILFMVADYKSNNNLETMSEYNKIKSINEYIMTKISYAKDSHGNPEDSYWAHNLEGFVNSNYNKGVCECYAKTCSLLTYVVGIDSILVTGVATSGGSSGGHAWNYVNIDNKWYGLDVTWNDNDHPNINKGNYFLVSKSTMNSDHTPYGQTYGSNFRVVLPELEAISYIHI